MTISERIKKRRIELGLSVEDVAEQLHKNRATIYRYENEDISSFPASILEPLAKVLRTTPAYLMGWEDHAPDYASLGLSPLPSTIKKPRLGRVACGDPILADENIEGYDDVPDYVNCDFTLLCEGDSMIGARIYDGDTVYVKLQETVENGQIAVVRIGDETTLKRFYRNGDTVTLMPENPKFAPLTFVKEQINDIRILGRAVAFTSLIK